MSELLQRLTTTWSAKGAELRPLDFLVLLALSGTAALLAAWLYVRFYGSRGTGSEIQRAFPLLGIAVTAIFICIQFSLPLSLGLLGALSIVRFRTPVKEPEEIAFLMIVIAAALACATGQLLFLGLLFVVALVLLLIQNRAGRLFGRRSGSGVVVVTLDVERYEAKRETLQEVLRRLPRGGRIESITTAGGVVTVAFRFHGLAAERAPELELALRREVEPQSASIVYASAGLP